MLFENVLQKKNEELEPEFIALFKEILTNQSHFGDLLLVKVNGFYNPEILTWDIENKSPYMLGIGMDGLSDFGHYKFINDYRLNNISKDSYEKYLERHVWSPERINEINELEKKEAASIQSEMLIYLKIWEADMFIKRFYQIVQISQGLPYDWHFRIGDNYRDKDSTGTRQEIIKVMIRDKLKDKYPKMYEFFKNGYRTEVRNAIAHSRYYLNPRVIHLTNFVKKPSSDQPQVLHFNEWINLFHDTMVLYNQLIGFNNRIDAFYAGLSEAKHIIPQVRLIKREVTEQHVFINLKFRPEFGDWIDTD